MSTATRLQDPHGQVQALLDSWVQAVQAKDVARIVSHYAADVVAYDAILQLQFVTSAFQLQTSILSGSNGTTSCSLCAL